MRKPNYSMERKDRERAKQAKAAAKQEKRAARSAENRDGDAVSPADRLAPGQPDPAQQDNS